MKSSKKTGTLRPCSTSLNLFIYIFLFPYALLDKIRYKGDSFWIETGVFHIEIMTFCLFKLKKFMFAAGMNRLY